MKIQDDQKNNLDLVIKERNLLKANLDEMSSRMMDLEDVLTSKENDLEE